MTNDSNISNEELIAEIKETNGQRGHKRGGWIYFAFIVVLILLGVWLIVSKRSKVIFEQTIHWHAKLIIIEGGVAVSILPSVGLLGDMTHPSSLHTHEADNVVHMEIQGPVQAEQVTLGTFFDVWGKDKAKIVQMSVNGKPSNDGYDYVMRDRDEIKLVFK